MEWDNRLVSRIIGLSLSVSVIMSVAIASQIADIKRSVAVSPRTGTRVSSPDESVVIPFDDAPEYDLNGKDSEKLYKVYRELVKAEKKKKQKQTVPAGSGETSASTTETTAASLPEETTVTTTASTFAPAETVTQQEATQPAETQAEQTVSNGKEPFCYSDVSSVASHLDTLGDFAEKLRPASYSWDTSEYEKKGCVRVTLVSEDGSVTLDVKPLEIGSVPYMIGGRTDGTETASVNDWDWYIRNKTAGCSIASVTWKTAGFAIAPVRGVGVGSSLADVTDSYLCVNGGATTLYKASDVLRDQSKLNTLLSMENAYTFVGGRFYTMSTYLDRYYASAPHSCPFSDCEYVVQYGCNSIMEHDYATGSWIIEYAVRDNAVAGITFLNKSYSNSQTKTAVSTETTQSASAVSSRTTAEEQTTTVPDSEPTQPESSLPSFVAPTGSESEGVTSESVASHVSAPEPVSSDETTPEVRSGDNAPESVGSGESPSTTATVENSDAEEE